MCNLSSPPPATAAAAAEGVTAGDRPARSSSWPGFAALGPAGAEADDGGLLDLEEEEEEGAGGSA